MKPSLAAEALPISLSQRAEELGGTIQHGLPDSGKGGQRGLPKHHQTSVVRFNSRYSAYWVVEDMR